MSNSSRNQLSIDLQAEEGPVITLRNGIHKQRCNFTVSTPAVRQMQVEGSEMGTVTAIKRLSRRTTLIK